MWEKVKERIKTLNPKTIGKNILKFIIIIGVAILAFLFMNVVWYYFERYNKTFPSPLNYAETFDLVINIILAGIIAYFQFRIEKNFRIKDDNNRKTEAMYHEKELVSERCRSFSFPQNTIIKGCIRYSNYNVNTYREYFDNDYKILLHIDADQCTDLFSYCSKVTISNLKLNNTIVLNESDYIFTDSIFVINLTKYYDIADKLFLDAYNFSRVGHDYSIIEISYTTSITDRTMFKYTDNKTENDNYLNFNIDFKIKLIVDSGFNDDGVFYMRVKEIEGNLVK